MALRSAFARTSATLLSFSILLVESCSSISFGNVLKTGEKLSTGDILSINNFKFTMQTDCNLVLYENYNAIRASNTPEKGVNCTFRLEGGELFIFSALGSMVWRSDTGGAYGKFPFILQPNGNVVVYGSPVWPTGALSRNRNSHAPPTKTINEQTRGPFVNNL